MCPTDTSAPGWNAITSRTRTLKTLRWILPDGGKNGFPPVKDAGGKYFFVPKMCNHCAESPCTQVCPVGATFVSPDGVVLVDKEYCLGCAYCVQACPYGCRFIIRRTTSPTSARSAITGLRRV